MRLYEFKNGDGTIDVTVTTDGSNNQKKVFVTATPKGPGYLTSGGLPEGTGAILELGFNFTNGVSYDHRDFVVFAEKAGLQLLQWDQGFSETATEIVPLGGTFVYTLTAESPVNFIKAGETKALTIVSTKQKLVNGVPEGAAIVVPSIIAISAGVGFTVSGRSIVATVNAAAIVRTGSVLITQNEGGKTAVIALVQAGV